MMSSDSARVETTPMSGGASLLRAVWSAVSRSISRAFAVDDPIQSAHSTSWSSTTRSSRSALAISPLELGTVATAGR